MNNATACTGGTLCNTTMGRCVACLNNSQCGGTTPLCDTTVGNCVACRGDGAPSCTDPAKPACQMTGALAGSCTECTSSTSCSGTRPICLTATGTCGCTDTDGDDECGGPTSGLVCSGPAGTCVPGCSTAANRNTCGTGQACSNTSGGVGSCIQGCANDNDCPTDPLRRCDSGQAPARCVQCLVDGQCASPLVCAETTTRTCVECTPTKTAACTAAGNGAACLTSGVCGCTSDFDCGTATSGRVCNTSLSRCVPGCRGSGGNTCAPNQTCTSSTNAIGSCQVVVVVPPPMPDAGVDMGTVVVVPPTDAAVDLPAPDRPVVVPDAPLVDMPLLLPPMVDAPMAAVDAPSTPTDTLQPPRASDAMRTSDALSMGEPDAMTGTISMPGMVDTVVDAAVARDMMAAPALPAGMDADPPATVPMDDGFIAGGGCGCRTAGAPSRAPAGASYLFAAVAVLLARRRRR